MLKASADILTYPMRSLTDTDKRRLKIIARGDVQRAGFWETVQKIGRDLGLCATAQNQEPYDARTFKANMIQKLFIYRNSLSSGLL